MFILIMVNICISTVALYYTYSVKEEIRSLIDANAKYNVVGEIEPPMNDNIDHI